jgi:2-alkyl-3-oxoalkanoate reductase
MRILVAGAVGRQLIPELVRRGHDVIGTTRTQAKLRAIEQAGAAAIILDALDSAAVLEVVSAIRPEVVVHQATALAGALDPRRFKQAFIPTNRLRDQGTRNLVDAARHSGARVVAQSYAGWPYAREGGPVKTEEDPLDPRPPAAFRGVLDALRSLEATVLDANGIVLRYGGFYGPGTSIAFDGEHAELLRRRRFPLIGAGTGVWSFVHVGDVATATALAIERGRPGIFNIVDDDPAPVAEWLPYAARLLGAQPPWRLPRWLGRLIAGEHVDVLMNEVRGASNAKAKAQLAWHLQYPTWRDGFRAALASPAA